MRKFFTYNMAITMTTNITTLFEKISTENIAYYFAVVFFTLAICGAFLPESIYASTNFLERLQGVSFKHLMGTDILGRDIFLRIVRGAYNVVWVAVPSVAFGLIVGGSLGLVSAVKKSNVRYIIGGFMDVIFAFPIILIALILVARYGSHPAVATITLAVFFVPVFYRVVYMTARPLYQMDYITSARLSGLSNMRLTRKHIFPNIKPVILMQCSVQLAMAILAEAGLGYLGLSVKSPDPTWGSLLLDAQEVIFINPMFSLPIGMVILGTVWTLIKMADTFEGNADDS